MSLFLLLDVVLLLGVKSRTTFDDLMMPAVLESRYVPTVRVPGCSQTKW
jgi:hypothetical protein